MCHNHSHVAAVLETYEEHPEYTEVEILVTQALTVELSSGAKLIVPRYTHCSLLLVPQARSWGSLPQAMVESGAVDWSRDEKPNTFGPTTPPK